MREVKEHELETEFEKNVPWADDRVCFHNPNRRKASVMQYFLRLETIHALIKKYARGQRVADMACAQGNIGLTLAEAGYDVTAVDIHPEFLKYARKKYTHGKFRVVEANLIEYRESLPYDVVVMGEVIEHVAEPKRLLKTAWENLKPGGLLVLSTPNGNEDGQPLPTYSQVDDLTKLLPRQFHWLDHLFLYTDEELRGLLQGEGFEVLEILKLNSRFQHQIKGVRYLLPLKLLKWIERRTRQIQKNGKDTTNNLVVAAQKRP